MSVNSWFYNFPQITYDGVLITDVLNTLRLQPDIVNNNYIYYEWDIINYDTPENIAYKYYGSSDYFWLVMLANNINDRYYDWIMSPEDFENFIIANFGSVQIAQQNLDHYEDSIGNTIDQATFTNNGGTIVSSYDYYFNLNESKRRIKLVDIQYLQQINKEFQQVVTTLSQYLT